jgi:hypothetical protein
VQARFALADIYDRADKGGTDAEPAAEPAAGPPPAPAPAPAPAPEAK